MARTSKPTRALASFGVYGLPTEDELAVLKLADAFREELCDQIWQEYRKEIDIRNAIPGVFDAMVHLEHLKSFIYAIESVVKQRNAKERDRNAITVEENLKLKAARSELESAEKLKKEKLKGWWDLKKSFSKWLGESGQARKNAKTLESRKAILGNLACPTEFKPLFDLYLFSDSGRRGLSDKYQALGLHSSIRAEIVVASEIKIKKDAPGIRYFYDRKPSPQPWTKIVLQISGGLKVSEALDGTATLKLTPIYTNHKKSGDETIYEVQQQIGTRQHPRLLTYSVKLHRSLKQHATIQRWSLVVRQNKRLVIPIVTDMDFSKPAGQGVFAYDLGWRVTNEGVQIAQFFGTHVNETLILPNWLVAARMSYKEFQSKWDAEANTRLKVTGYTGKVTGVAGVYEFLKRHDDLSMRNWMDDCEYHARAAHTLQKRAERTIVKIYELVSSRVCRLHDTIVPDSIDIAKLIRSKTRDLTRPDDIASSTRERRQCLAPGKLQALLLGYGLKTLLVDCAGESNVCLNCGANNPTSRDKKRKCRKCKHTWDRDEGAVLVRLARADMLDPNLDTSRNTDLFSTYVKSLGVKTGPKTNKPNHRSQYTSQTTDKSVVTTPG